MANVEEEERQLTTLYAQRQELLKELTEVDNQIKALESKQTQRHQAQQQQRQAILAVSTGDSDLDTIRDILEKATHDQTGLREAQKIIESACRLDRVDGETDEAYAKRRRFRNMFIRQIIDRSPELMVDPHGNYFVQRALTFLKNGGSVSPPPGDLDYDATTGSISEVIALLERLGNSVGDISCNMHGTRAVQRIIDILSSVEEFELFCDLVANDLVALIKDLNGNHSISRLLVSQSFMKLGEPDGGSANPLQDALKEKGQNVRKDIYHIVAANCVEICRNRQGCCIIQRCLQWAPEPFRTEIINAALLNSLKLVQDPFGNYVVQYILDLQQQLVQHNPEEAETLNYTNRIIRQILHNVALLSCNKFSSNVIEKCLKTSSPEVRQLLIDELTDPHALPKLLTDSFANYVVQTAITTATDEAQFAQLRDAILPLQHLLKNSPYGIKIEAKLLKRHRDAAKKVSRQNRAVRDGQQRGGQTSTSSPTVSIPSPGARVVDASSMQPIRVSQQQVSGNFPTATAMAGLGADPMLGAAFFQQAFSQNQQPQMQYQQMQFMMQNPNLVGGMQQSQGQQFSAQQQVMLQMQNQQQQAGSSWAVSSHGNYTAVHQQHQNGQQPSPTNRSGGAAVNGKFPASVPQTAPATHSPYTAYTGSTF